jgi:hypothetical protein
MTPTCRNGGAVLNSRSRIYSHVTNSFNYGGFKGLFLGYHDGKSFFGPDFSLHGEKGDEKKPDYKQYGLTGKQRKARYSKKRSAKSAGKQRGNEYFRTKTEMLVEIQPVFNGQKV